MRTFYSKFTHNFGAGGTKHLKFLRKDYVPYELLAGNLRWQKALWGQGVRP